MDKFAKAASNATIALIGFQFLSRKGGLDLSSIGNLFSGLGGKIGGAGKIGSAISSFAGGISAAAKGLLRFVPIIGQIGLAGFVINEFSKVFSDKSFFDRIYQAFGGLSDSAENAKNKFNEIATQIFDPSGQYVGRSAEERRTSLEQTRNASLQKLEAQRRGVNTSGKTDQEIAAENFRSRIAGSIADVSTGRTVSTQRRSGGFVGDLGLGPNTYSETVSRLSSSAQEILIETVSQVTTGTLEELKNLAESKGLKLPKNSDINQVQSVIAKAFVEDAVNKTRIRTGGKQTFSSVLESERGRARISDLGLDFIGRPRAQTPEANKTASSGKSISPEVQKLREELRSLIIDGAINSLEAEIKSIEGRADISSSQSARSQLLNSTEAIQKRIFDQQRQQLLFNTQSKAREIRNSGKPEQEIQTELEKLKQEYSNQRDAIRFSSESFKREARERDKTTRELIRFNAAISNAESALSTLSVREASADANIAALQARASDPSLSFGAQQNIQSQANRAEIERLGGVNLEQSIIKLGAAIEEANLLQDDGEKELALKKAADTFEAENKARQSQIFALEEATRQLFLVKDSATSLVDAIDQFSNSLGESRGQNQFNLLQATDSNSIAQGLIGERVYDSAGNRQGAELVSFIAQQNALLNEQFKIKTAASETERLELQRSYDLTNELIQIRNSGLDPIREQAALEKAINDNLEKRRTFGAGVEDATAGMRDRIQSFNADFGRTATDGFKDALSGAIKAAVSETTNLKDALLDVALQFANSLRDRAIDNLADVFTNSLFGKGGSSGGSSGNIVSSLVGAVGGFFSGGVQKKAAGGQVTGGTGMKDDVPTLLMGGEYVIPKNVVQSYGKGFFDRLRDGSIGKMAQGGYFAPGVRGQGTISGKESLLDFATQTATSGKGDIVSSLGANAGLVSLEPESLRLSNFARFGDSPILQATQETKEQAFGLYLDQLSAEKEYQKYLDDLKKAEKEKTKQFWISLAVAAVGAGVGAYANSAGAGAKAGTAAKAATSTAGNQRYYDVATGLLKSTAQGYSSSRTSSPSSGFNSSLSAPNNIPQFEWREMMRQFSGQISNYGSSFGGNPLFNGINTSGRYNGRGYNSGGAVSGNGDTVPAMLSNKEFVLNSSAAQKIGYKDLYAMNSGANPSNGESETRIVAKLDELIEKTIGASNISVNVSMTNSGENNQQDNSQQSDSNASERQRFLTQRLKDTVISVLREEQRPGGLLTSTRR